MNGKVPCVILSVVTSVVAPGVGRAKAANARATRAQERRHPLP